MKQFFFMFVFGLVLLSCRKDSFSCSLKSVAGTYYNKELNQTIFIDFDYSSTKQLRVEIPDIHPYGFHHLHFPIDQQGCSFVFKSFYDNYGESSIGPHYWMVGNGGGYFELGRVIFDYNIIVKNSEGNVIKDADFSYSFVKQ